MKVVFSCGRVNPPTLGHLKIVETMKRLGNARLFLTKSVGDRNPLSPEIKLEMVKRAFDCSVKLTTSPYSALEELKEEGAKEVIFVIGEDRAKQFSPMEKYAKELDIDFRLEILPRTDDDVSASQAREAVLKEDFEAFKSLVPSPDETFAEDLYRAVKLGLGV